MLLLLSGEGHSTVWRGQVHPVKKCMRRVASEPSWSHTVCLGTPSSSLNSPQPQCSQL